MEELAHQTDTKSKQNFKVWYDRTAHLRSFKEGDLVLVLMPDAQDKLSARWQGPYSIMKQVSPASYELGMADHCKRKRQCHVNMIAP